MFKKTARVRKVVQGKERGHPLKSSLKKFAYSLIFFNFLTKMATPTKVTMESLTGTWTLVSRNCS